MVRVEILSLVVPPNRSRRIFWWCSECSTVPCRGKETRCVERQCFLASRWSDARMMRLMTPIASEEGDPKQRYRRHRGRCKIAVLRNKRFPPVGSIVVRRSPLLIVPNHPSQLREPDDEPGPISAEKLDPPHNLLIIFSGSELLNGAVLYESIRLCKRGKHTHCFSAPAASEAPDCDAHETGAGER